jgi:dTMP kinase
LGSYVALEGGDGTGKSTVAAALVASLEGRGETVTQVREPGGTALGEVVRTLLLDSESVEPWAEVMLFAAQRAELAGEVIRPALARGEWVVSDRTYYSSIAYQGRARGLGEDTVRRVNEVALDGTVPDWVFVLDIEPAAGLERQDDPDRIGNEGVDFQTAVREAYQTLAEQEPGKVIALDATRPVDELVGSIMTRLDIG